MSVIDDVRLVLVKPHKAGWPFLAGAGTVVLVGLVLGWGWLAWIGAALLLFCLYFFRDPERVPPLRVGVIVAPADGLIVSVGPAVPPEELELGGAPRWRVAIFLSVLDVHVNRSPAEGVVARIVYRAGAFVSAALDKASESNERNGVVLRLGDGRELGVVQIAGLVARRIVCQVREGDRLAAGERFGLIRFGSRTDLYLPAGIKPLVREGQRAVGGETVIAQVGADGGLG